MHVRNPSTRAITTLLRVSGKDVTVRIMGKKTREVLENQVTPILTQQILNKRLLDVTPSFEKKKTTNKKPKGGDQ